MTEKEIEDLPMIIVEITDDKIIAKPNYEEWERLGINKEEAIKELKKRYGKKEN